MMKTYLKYLCFLPVVLLVLISTQSCKKGAAVARIDFRDSMLGTYKGAYVMNALYTDGTPETDSVVPNVTFTVAAKGDSSLTVTLGGFECYTDSVYTYDDRFHIFIGSLNSVNSPSGFLSFNPGNYMEFGSSIVSTPRVVFKNSVWGQKVR